MYVLQEDANPASLEMIFMRTVWLFDRRPSSFLKVISLQASICMCHCTSWGEPLLSLKWLLDMKSVFFQSYLTFLSSYQMHSLGLFIWFIDYCLLITLTVELQCYCAEWWNVEAAKCRKTFFVEICSIDLLLSIKTFYAFFSWK